MKKCLAMLFTAAFMFVFSGTALAQEPQGPPKNASTVKSGSEKKKVEKKSKAKKAKKNGSAMEDKKEGSKGEAHNVPVTPPWSRKGSTP